MLHVFEPCPVDHAFDLRTNVHDATKLLGCRGEMLLPLSAVSASAISRFLLSYRIPRRFVGQTVVVGASPG
jgi:hypothetical protein